jgi:RNA polymerase subunit RPABC4/transcription elongation factor Spt4
LKAGYAATLIGSRVSTLENGILHRKSVMIRVAVLCNRCSASGALLRNLREVLDFHAHSHAVALGPLLLAGAGSLLVWVWMTLFPVGPRLLLVGVAAAAGLCVVVRQRIPLRALACPKCKRILRWGFGHRIPGSWKHHLEFSAVCMTCSYPLNGLIVARCPECGDAFPEEWLKATVVDPESAEIVHAVVALDVAHEEK